MFNEFQGDRQVVDNQIAKLTQADDTYYLTVNYLGDLARRSDELFASSIPEEKHRLLALTLSNLKLSGKKIEYIVRKPFDQVVACNVSQSWGRLREATRTLFECYPMPKCAGVSASC